MRCRARKGTTTTECNIENTILMATQQMATSMAIRPFWFLFWCSAMLLLLLYIIHMIPPRHSQAQQRRSLPFLNKPTPGTGNINKYCLCTSTLCSPLPSSPMCWATNSEQRETLCNLVKKSACSVQCVQTHCRFGLQWIPKCDKSE